MMNTQQSSTFIGSVSHEALRDLPAGHVVALGTGGGQLSILSGSVWLTRSGDPSDHFLAAGESFDVRDSGQTLVETSNRGAPAVIAWQPRSVAERVRDSFLHASARCWDLVNPARRLGIGSVAAVAALVVAGALFGPVSDGRARSIAATVGGAVLLHNVPHGTAGAARGNLADGIDTGDRTPSLASQAGRRPPGAA